MLKITIPSQEFWSEEKQEFCYVKETTIQLEHSLVSLSKWESKWHKPFLKDEEKTVEETIDYIRCMTLTQNVNPDVFRYITEEVMQQVSDYIEDPMTATWFSKKLKPPNRDIITSEVIYYWMVALQIPFECQKWHLNRLITLIRVCDEMNAPKKKRSARQIAMENAKINAARRKALHTKG